MEGLFACIVQRCGVAKAQAGRGSVLSRGLCLGHCWTTGCRTTLIAGRVVWSGEVLACYWTIGHTRHIVPTRPAPPQQTGFFVLTLPRQALA